MTGKASAPKRTPPRTDGEVSRAATNNFARIAAAVAALSVLCLLAVMRWTSMVPLLVRMDEGHPISLWMRNTSHSRFLDNWLRQDIELRDRGLLARFFGPREDWRGTAVSGSVRWPVAGWRAHFQVLPSLVLPHEALAMKEILLDAPDQFDEDVDGVDKILVHQRTR
mmetsp:Transcript_76212/g.137542  ORF Transcript_76212/g.137542 Transcript_76212/m.137542 type:complete len:167 (+) Transcript_76212:19-519(+)